MTKIGTTHTEAAYTAKNGCRTIKHFRSREAAQTWLDRVGATDVSFFSIEMTEHGWSRK